MRWYLITPLASIHPNNRVGVDWITLVWVDDNAKQSRIGLKNIKTYRIINYLRFSVMIKL